MPNRGTDVIFLGNLGRGKSTIASAVSGHRFKSGVNWVGGLTMAFDYQHDKKGRDIRWADTAGLADPKQAKIAAKTIQEALNNAAKDKRIVKLVFVINLTAGRLNHDDSYVIEQVLRSINLPGGKSFEKNQYMVLVNKVEEKLFQSNKFQNGGMGAITNYFATGIEFPTDKVFFVPFDKALDVEDNGSFSDQNTVDTLETIIIEKCPAIEFIDGAELIDTDSIQEQLDKQKAHMEEYYKPIIDGLNEKIGDMEIKNQKNIEELNGRIRCIAGKLDKAKEGLKNARADFEESKKNWKKEKNNELKILKESQKKENAAFQLKLDKMKPDYEMKKFVGKEVKISSTRGNGRRYLDASGGNRKNGTNVLFWPFHGRTNQKWVIKTGHAATENCYVICSYMDESQVLDVAGGGTRDKTNVLLWGYQRKPHQQWRVVCKDGNGFKLEPYHARGMALDCGSDYNTQIYRSNNGSPNFINVELF